MVPYLSMLIKLKFMIWFFQVAFSPRSNQLWTNLERIPISTFASFHLKPWLVHFCNIYMLSLTSCCFASHSMTGKKMIINCLHLLKFETINYISKKMVFFSFKLLLKQFLICFFQHYCSRFFCLNSCLILFLLPFSFFFCSACGI